MARKKVQFHNSSKTLLEYYQDRAPLTNQGWLEPF